MNFEWDGKLAERQDRVLNALSAHQAPLPNDVYMLRSNCAVWFFSIFSPCNISVRHYCILDILDDRPIRYQKIYRLMGILTRNKTSLWLEGYSYWGYTANALKPWAEKFYLDETQKDINTMELQFNRTGYAGPNKTHCPAPFGDVYNQLLSSQVTTMGDSIPPVYSNGRVVWIDSKAVRFNLHTSFVYKCYNIVNGVPVDFSGRPFKFYEGYKEKYPTRWREICAIVKRLFQLLAGCFV